MCQAHARNGPFRQEDHRTVRMDRDQSSDLTPSVAPSSPSAGGWHAPVDSLAVAGAILRYPSNNVGTKWTDVYLGAFKFRVVDTHLSRQTVQVLCQPWCEVVRFVRPCLPDTRAFEPNGPTFYSSVPTILFKSLREVRITVALRPTQRLRGSRSVGPFLSRLENAATWLRVRRLRPVP